MDMQSVSIHGEKYCQVFGNKDFFAAAYLILARGDNHQGLESVADYRAPEFLITDGSKEQIGAHSQFRAKCCKNNIHHQKVSEPERHNQNPAEGVIREARKRWFRTVFKTNCPQRLWT
jgi:hypothetical protein